MADFMVVVEGVGDAAAVFVGGVVDRKGAECGDRIVVDVLEAAVVVEWAALFGDDKVVIVIDPYEADSFIEAE